MKNLGQTWKRVSFGFLPLFLFSVILALTSPASAGSGQLVVSPSTINFGTVSVGTSQAKAITLTNSGGSKLSVTQATLSGADFALSGLNYPLTIPGGQSATCYVSFNPQAASTYSGNVSISFSTQSGKGHNNYQSTATPTITLPVSGTGVTSGQLATNPGSLVFGNVQVGASQTLSETLTNSGGAAVTISAIGASSSFTASGLTLPTTLGAGQSVSFSVAFSPTSSGTASGTMTITSDGSNPSLNVPLSGTGMTPGQLTTNPASLLFGSVQVGSSRTLTETLTNSGGSAVIISAVTGASSFTTSGLTLPTTLSAGQSVSFSVAFAPTSSGNASGAMTITSNGSNPSLSVPLSGTGTAPGQLSTSPGSLTFGSVQVGNSQTLTETLTNTGGSSLTISAASATSGFTPSGLTVPTTLSSGQTVSFSVAFAPTSSGPASGAMTITSNGSNPSLSIPLSGAGTALGQLTTSPASLTFGNVQVGNSQTLTETLTNAGGSSLTISAASATSGFTPSGLALPTTLSAGQSVSFSVAFAPTSSGPASGTMTITSNGSNPSLSVPLSGTGTTLGQLASNPGSLAFGNVQIGNSQTLAETLTNSGGSSLTISAVSATSSFTPSGLTLPTTLSGGQSVSFSVAFTPATSGTVSGSMTITSTASNPSLNVPVSGTATTPGQLSVSPASMAFGSVPVGNSASLVQTIKNSGGSAVTISQIAPTGAGFGINGITLPITLAAAQSVTFNVSFAPQAGGSVTGNLAITSNGSNPNLSVPLTGTGGLPGQLTITPATLNFGSLVLGTSQSQTGVLSAGNAAVTVSSLGVSGSQFSVTGISLPATIAAGNSISFQVTFTPKTAGAQSSNLTFVSNASNSPTVESLTGSATAPQHSVTLSWNTSTSSDVVGYNIYRGTVSDGSYARINSALDTAPTATDNTVQAGQTYYYVTTAVDSTGTESSYSNQVQVVVPTP